MASINSNTFTNETSRKRSGSTSTSPIPLETPYDDDEKPQRKRSRKEEKQLQTCRVCGDKAFSVNFNVVTCESCKAFFRRNALRPNQDLRCQTGNCIINTFTRRSCKKCRLQKCFQVGMIKEWILNEEARNRKREQIERNRAERLRLAVLATAAGDSFEAVFTKFGDVSPTSYSNTAPKSYANYASSNKWQTHESSHLNQEISTLSQFFERFNFYTNQSSTTFYSGPLLPIQRPSNGTSNEMSMFNEMIHIPKIVLATLLNQYHLAQNQCAHQHSKFDLGSSIMNSNRYINNTYEYNSASWTNFDRKFSTEDEEIIVD